MRAGGGVNHRGNLSDGILVKDNHLGGLSVEEAVERARRRWPGRTVQIECDTTEQVKAALVAGAELVLLDNMTPDEVRNRLHQRLDESGSGSPGGRGAPSG